MKKLIVAALLAVSAMSANALSQPYWWTVLDAGGTKLEVDVNNLQQLTAVTRTAPARLTTPGFSTMYNLMVNCDAKEAMVRGEWKKATPADMFICK